MLGAIRGKHPPSRSERAPTQNPGSEKPEYLPYPAVDLSRSDKQSQKMVRATLVNISL